jgi:hypothetical protein
MRSLYQVAASVIVGTLVNLHFGGHCLGMAVALGLLVILQECASN